MHALRFWSVCALTAAPTLLSACSSSDVDSPRPAAAAADTVTVFEHARLITGDRTPPVEDSAIVVEGSQFVAVGRRRDVQVREGARRIDLTGKTVMPALVDVHSHLGFLKAVDGTMAKENFTHENLIDQLQRYAYHGFAAVISVGTDIGDLPFELREEVIPDAALFRTVGRGLAWPGSGPADPARNDVPYSVTTEDEARAAVRDLAPKRPDFVKIWVDDRNGRQKKLTPPLFTAAIDEARKLNLPAIAHVYDLEDAKGLVRAGAVGFTHLVRDADIDDELVGLLKERPDVFFIPNIGITARGIESGRPKWLDDPLLHETIPPGQIAPLVRNFADRKPDVLARTRAEWDRAVRNIATLRAHGVPLVFGSDSAGDPSRLIGWHAMWELQSLVMAGIPPDEAIVDATSVAAKALKLDQRFGTVAPGKSADFVVLDANPLDDIANTRRIDKVFLRGQEVNREALRARWQLEWSATSTR
jgi:imidazolonepropionase-like amidohydrolase